MEASLFLVIVRGLLTLEFYFRFGSEVEQPGHPVVYRAMPTFLSYSFAHVGCLKHRNIILICDDG